MSRLNKFLIFLIALLILSAQITSFEAKDTQSKVSLPTPTPTATPIPVADPKYIVIPKLGVQAQIEPVSTDFDGKMNMPEDYSEVAWYSPGAKPGESGNSVIAGHLDKITGAPALFYNLKNLEQGDEITVTAEDGKQYTFTVTGKAVYLYNQVPLDQVFGLSKEKNLNLMTCTGIWDLSTHNYSQRLVIFTTLK